MSRGDLYNYEYRNCKYTFRLLVYVDGVVSCCERKDNGCVCYLNLMEFV